MPRRTRGEALCGRPLMTERVNGVPHYVPGQHYAEYADSAKMAADAGIEDDGCDAVIVSYVDQMGHAVCVLAAQEEPGGQWKPQMIARAGHQTLDPWAPAPESFVLSDKMLEAIDRAKRRGEG